MKYFSFASKFAAFAHSNRRTLSYKIRKSLVYMLTKMDQDPKTDTMKVNFVKKGQQTQIPRFMIQVLGNGACDSSSVIAVTGKESYLFNCGEGVQRFATCYHIKLIKIYSIFITSHSWANVGGIMGVALTLQSLGVEKLLIYGPPSLKQVTSGWESFVTLKTLTVQVITDVPKSALDDGCLNIQFVPLYKSCTPSNKHYQQNSELSCDLNNEQNVKFENSEGERSQATASSNESETYVQCYICTTPHFGKHLNVEACVEKGLQIGPILNVLKTNKSVTLSDGKVVHLDEVCSSPGVHKVFIVVECPSAKYLNSLINEKAFIAYQEFSAKPADLIIHYTPPEILNEPLYQEWMSKFPQTTQHLVLNSDNTFANLIPVYHVQTKLNYLNQEIFPLLCSHGLPCVKKELSGKMGKATIFSIYSCKDEQEEKMAADNMVKSMASFSQRQVLQHCPEIYHNINGVTIMRPLSTTSIQYHPKLNIDYKHNIAFDPLNCIREIKKLDNIEEDLKELADFVRQWKESDKYKNLSDYPKILFLGTGSSMPSTYRSTSAILIYLNEDNLILLDCGEGTYQQIVQHIGKEKIPEFMEKLKMIYVSHHHADHHMGMINILIQRQRLLANCKNDGNGKEKERNIVLLVPSTISTWLRANEKNFESFLDDTIIIKSGALLEKNCPKEIEPLLKIGVSSLQLCRVSHCWQSCGVSLTVNNNFKITYSGDCRPSQSLIEIGKNSDILIHEATFEDELQRMAVRKSHCTISEAINVGQAMNAKFTILTHFSQRYSSLPYLPDTMPENVAIAFDNMMVSAKTLPILQKLSKFYKRVFAEKLEMLNSKVEKRNMKREIESGVSAKIRVTS